MSKRGTDARFRKSKLKSLQDRANVAGYELTVRQRGHQDWVYELRSLRGEPVRFPEGGGSNLWVTLFAAEMAVVEVTTPRR